MSKFLGDAGVEDIAAAIKAKADATYAAISHQHEQADIKYGGLCWYGTSSTTESTSTKAVTCSHFADSHQNVFLAVKFSAANTRAVQINLDVNSIGQRVVSVHGGATSSANPLTWAAGDVLMFMFMTSTYVYLGGSSTMGDAIPSPSSTAPLVDGTASAGSSADYARGDHVHPTDTSRAAASHTHAASDVSSGTLDLARIPTGTTASTVALGNHTHAASDIGSGTLDIARIPTGSTSSTVALGNHTHSEYAPTSHTHEQADMDDGAFAWYATCDADPYEDSKAVACSGYEIKEGAVVFVLCETANEVDDAITFNINSTGRMNVNLHGQATEHHNEVLWAAGDVLTFVCTGSAYEYVTGSSVMPSLIGAAAESHSHAASAITSGTISINNGGTGQSSVSTESTISTLITAASGTTITAATFKQWGKLAMLTVSFKRTSSWAANAQVDVGTVKTGYRPAVIINGGNANVLAHLNGAGVMRARNMTGAAIATTTQQDIGFTFLLP